MTDTIAWQRFEGAVLFVTAMVLIALWATGLSWWMMVVIFFAPDLSFAAYALGPRIGAFCYNLLHLYGFGAVMLALGAVMGQTWLVGTGVLWLAHAGFDRMLGYGLKSATGFTDTHLGVIGTAR